MKPKLILTFGLDHFDGAGHQVRAISGHATVEMVRQYGRDFIAKQAGLQAAMLAVNEPSIGKTLSK